jgi:hypothetical protein
MSFRDAIFINADFGPGRLGAKVRAEVRARYGLKERGQRRPVG